MEIPFFPLSMIPFPKEEVNLHVFEPRYKQLVNDCLRTDTSFGMPYHINDQLQKMGTELRITEVANRYEDGRMDIRTEAIRTFRVLSFENPWRNRLYAGGDVVFNERPMDDSTPAERRALVQRVNTLMELLKVNLRLEEEGEFLLSRIIHKIGLEPSEELVLVQIPSESERIGRVIEHLDKLIPIVRSVETTKQRIMLNGHFKNFDSPLNF